MSHCVNVVLTIIIFDKRVRKSIKARAWDTEQNELLRHGVYNIKKNCNQISLIKK